MIRYYATFLTEVQRIQQINNHKQTRQRMQHYSIDISCAPQALKAEAEEHRLGGDRLKTPAVLEHEATPPAVEGKERFYIHHLLETD